jgi:hypothetical protein
MPPQIREFWREDGMDGLPSYMQCIGLEPHAGRLTPAIDYTA